MNVSKLILHIIVFFLIFPVFGQNGINEGKYFLLPENNNKISINSFLNSKINRIHIFKTAENSIYTTNQKDKVAIIDIDNNQLQIIDINSLKEIKLSIPFKIKAYSLILNEERLFIGGIKMEPKAIDGAVLIQYNLKSNEWSELDIPKEVMIHGKAIDDIVVHDNLLIAIDNLVSPKYILYYELKFNNEPSFSYYKKLNVNNPSENIHKARITKDYLGLYSTSWNINMTHNEHLTIYSDYNLKKYFILSNYENTFFNDFILNKDELYIAHRSKGLGVLKIKSNLLKELNKTMFFNDNVLDSSLIEYNDNYSGEIIKLTIIPNTSYLVLTKRKLFGIKNKIIKLD
ncbi:hypothetical protein MY04_4278 [Flammeovirga sp. MY04]|uniref:hypothetical protein n=1 Tax=Flammeovirga sp. MY04 TaxID=1191459 RepID=UPI00080612FA|nr:hypothetical protein [Flammeovirga sp. MY04]ANQ51620.1 hypothetical protein MY04_4278 [Flammeovirga sp. MY04]